MHPITAIEIIFSVVFVLILFGVALFLPHKIRKPSLIIVSSITVLLLLSFAIRPYWIDYQVSRKTEQLNHYLEERYPNQEWEISRQVGRQYNPYHLQVRFKNEKGWIYIYSVVNEKKIHQSVWIPPGGKFFEEGKHYESYQLE
ncbi:hypothetical protein R50345_10435 [Paenibacillus sp. FSL R5-0345]|uniref:hypothetical protein n=1 Tax=unclassified Paenibacillus TaxID=185978 RepID=UPI0004F85D65|nr:hypothetical protein [Paenibacillus sp. FSL R5-0345]AIQ34984.1 hypothetical protein R50345_10435 [Paenibacillus sp. FSL R5-0345]